MVQYGGMDAFPSLRKSLYFRIPWVRAGIGANMLVNIGFWAFVYSRVQPYADPVPFHVSVYFGIDYTAPYWYYFLFPLGGLIVLITHAAVGRLFYRSQPILTLILLSISVLVQAVAWGVVGVLTRYLE